MWLSSSEGLQTISYGVVPGLMPSKLMPSFESTSLAELDLGLVRRFPRLSFTHWPNFYSLSVPSWLTTTLSFIAFVVVMPWRRLMRKPSNAEAAGAQPSTL